MARTSGSASAERKSERRSAAVPLNEPERPRAWGITTGRRPASRKVSAAPSTYSGLIIDAGESMATLSPVLSGFGSMSVTE